MQSARTSVHAVATTSAIGVTVHCSVDDSTRSTSRRTNNWPGSRATSTATPSRSYPIESLAAYRWSSYGVYLGRRRPPPMADARARSPPFDRSDAEVHRAFVETPQPTDEIDAGALAMLAHHLSFDRLLEVVGRMLPASTSDRSRRPRRDDATPTRTVALMLAVELRLAPATDLADRFRLATASSVRTIARRWSRCGRQRSRIVIAARTGARRAVRPAQPVAKCLTPRDRFSGRGRCVSRRGSRAVPAGRSGGRSSGRRPGRARGATPACACRR